MTATLTPAQTKVAILLGRGLRLKEIGGVLDISEETVKCHASRARKATGAQSNCQLAVMVALERQRTKLLQATFERDAE